MEAEFDRKIALIIGACGAVGTEVVESLAERGAVVAAVDRDGGKLCDEVERLQAKGLKVAGRQIDITSSQAVDALVDQVEREFGPIDILVNVAGLVRQSPAVSLTDEDWTQSFRVNADGVFHVSRAVASRMVARRSGSIVTVASNTASVPQSGFAAFAASRAAAIAYTKCLALEVARHGVRCNVVAPGQTEAPMLRSLSVAAEHDEGTGANRLVQPTDVADAVLFLLSDRADHLTMQDLYLDGGAALGA
jgi:2,3-dihydro-2,3-dihydroxybenzoate dehydrogenase